MGFQHLPLLDVRGAASTVSPYWQTFSRRAATMSALDDLLAEVEDVIGGGGGSGGKDKRKDAVATGMEGDWPYTSSSRESGYRGSSYQTNSSARVEHFAGSRSSTDHGSEASFTSSFAASKYDGGQHKEDHSFDVSWYNC